ncbi:MAG: paraquat-inducible protein A [Gammaproteobacteria bacterium]|nr:paraquat-inducible protein A [Gammaproteobacteria bacterium]
MTSAALNSLANCHVCGKLTNISVVHCPRCGTRLRFRKPDSIQRTVALVITACILYIPANVLPIMYTDQLGKEYQATIIYGVIEFWEGGSYLIASVIFLASIFIPMTKMFTLFWLCWSVSKKSVTKQKQRTKIYGITEFIGRWSMIDVFVVAITVALIHLGGILTIRPGAAALAFAGVVIVTMIAARSFDPRLIWDATQAPRKDNGE